MQKDKKRYWMLLSGSGLCLFTQTFNHPSHSPPQLSSPSAPAASRSRPPSCREAVGGLTPLRTPPGLRRGTAPSWGRATRSQSPPRCVHVSPSASSPFVWIFHPETAAPGEAGGPGWSVGPQTSSSGRSAVSLRSPAGVWSSRGFSGGCVRS